MKTIRCRRCDGHGFVGWRESVNRVSSKIPCPRCRGALTEQIEEQRRGSDFVKCIDQACPIHKSWLKFGERVADHEPHCHPVF